MKAIQAKVDSGVGVWEAEKSKLKNEAGDGSKIYTLLNNHISDLQSIIDKYIGITQIANERRTYKERLKKENEILCSRTKEKINKNQSEIESSSRKALNHSKQITGKITFYF